MRRFVKIILYTFIGIIVFLAVSVSILLLLFGGGGLVGDDTKQCGTAFLITLDDPTRYNVTTIVAELRALENFSAAHLLDQEIIEPPNKINVSLIRMPFDITHTEAQDFYSALKKIEYISKVADGNSCFIEELYWGNQDYGFLLRK